ncbi:MAG TPA: serine protease [Elusimicrobiota bacterium]|nr:serine protease [Elusimicrobiota bacterium]
MTCRRKTLLLAAGFFLAAAPRLRAAPRFGAVPQPMIYGRDDRHDLYQVQARLQALAGSAPALFYKEDVAIKGGTAYLKNGVYGKDYKLESRERFYSEPDGAFCSGALISPDVVATAGHCVTSAKDCRDTEFVFGFSLSRPDSSLSSVPASEVYGCAGLIARKYTDNGQDWSLVRLDRPVPNHPPLALDKDAHPRVGEPLFMIGYPSGLPAKVSENARIVSLSTSGYFSADLDDAAGNSGSPVFDARTDLVEGFLVRGEPDFVKHGFILLRPFGLYRRTTARCPDAGFAPNSNCAGEDVTEVGPILKALSGLMFARSRPGVNVASTQKALGRLKSAAGDFDGR